MSTTMTKTPLEVRLQEPKPAPTIGYSGPRNVFFYLCAMITLYLGSINLGTILFQLINAAFPDPLLPTAGWSALRWSVASLLVIFPVFIWTSRAILKTRLACPEGAEPRVRQWVIYLTIFLAGGVVAGDLITLVYNLLEGELTVRFLLKVAAVMVIAAGIFGYFMQDLRRSPRALVPLARIAAAAAGVMVLAAIVAGMTTSGSPFRQRLVRFDEQKVSDLAAIQERIVNYWRYKQSLPESLDALNDPIIGFHVPTDPQSHKAYEYRVTGQRSFELCAEFNRPSETTAGYAPRGYRPDESWRHEKGRQCFQRDIDPKLYPPIRDDGPRETPSPNRG